MGNFYLDSNALVRWAEGLADGATAEQQVASARIAELVTDDASEVAMSEYTFIEFHDRVLRYQAMQKVEYDAPWVDRVQTAFMELLETGRIQVLPPAPRAIDVAMSYISTARDAGVALKAVDALHLHAAIDWAHDTKTQVTVVTGDRAFSRFLAFAPAAGRFLSIEEVNVTQAVEPGTDLPLADS
jgi:hypothetical protein